MIPRWRQFGRSCTLFPFTSILRIVSTNIEILSLASSQRWACSLNVKLVIYTCLYYVNIIICDWSLQLKNWRITFRLVGLKFLVYPLFFGLFLFLVVIVYNSFNDASNQWTNECNNEDLNQSHFNNLAINSKIFKCSIVLFYINFRISIQAFI